MSPKDGADTLKTSMDSDQESAELLDLDSDSCSQTSQITTGVCDACDVIIGADDTEFVGGDGRRWHSSCLPCCVCGAPPDSKCFLTRQGYVLCNEDYNRIFNSCRRCGQRFTSPWEMAIVVYGTSPARRYHPDCFSCGLCQRRMHKHEFYSTGPDDVYCPAHAHGVGPSITSGPAAEAISFRSQNRPGRGRRRGGKRAGTRLPPELAEARRKRHRIQFSPQQLRELQTSFTSNPNPDSKAIFDLANRLGLGKQHVQVWFQNRRAKERRIKSESPSSES